MSFTVHFANGTEKTFNTATREIDTAGVLTIKFTIDATSPPVHETHTEIYSPHAWFSITEIVNDPGLTRIKQGVDRLIP